MAKEEEDNPKIRFERYFAVEKVKVQAPLRFVGCHPQ